MISTASYLRVVRASAWYDLAVTIAFATPWSFAAMLAGLNALSERAGLAAGFPPFEAAHLLMANLLGSLVTVWAILRLRDTRVLYGRYDAAGRLLFASWQLYALVHGGHPFIFAFLAAEVAFCIAQALPVADEVYS